MRLASSSSVIKCPAASSLRRQGERFRRARFCALQILERVCYAPGNCGADPILFEVARQPKQRLKSFHLIAALRNLCRSRKISEQRSQISCIKTNPPRRDRDGFIESALPFEAWLRGQRHDFELLADPDDLSRQHLVGSGASKELAECNSG